MVLTAAASVAGVTLASAQVSDPVEFTTAFPFTVGNTTMPAGKYGIRRDSDNPSVYRIEGDKKHVGALFEVEPTSMTKTPEKTEVIFKRYGQGYVLKSVWEAGSQDGVETVVAEAERHHVKDGNAIGEQHVTAQKHAKASTD